VHGPFRREHDARRQHDAAGGYPAQLVVEVDDAESRIDARNDEMADADVRIGRSEIAGESDETQRPAYFLCSRSQRVFFRSFLCFFLRIFLRRFLSTDPINPL
jgi:hypothetical protein